MNGSLITIQGTQRHTRSIWALVALLALWAASRPTQDDAVNYVVFALIAGISVAPAIAWSMGAWTFALPLFALYAISFLWAYAMPMLDRHPLVVLFSTNDRMFAGIAVFVHLFAAFLAWRWWWRRPIQPPRSLLVLKSGGSFALFFTLFAVCVLHEISFRAGWLTWVGGWYPIVRAAIGSVTLISMLTLAFRIGRGEGETIHRALFATLFVVYCIASATGLLLVNAIIALGAVVFGLTLGSGRFPWKVLAIGFSAITFLHLGKEKMREHQWSYLGVPQVTPAQYLEVYSMWAGFSLDRLDSLDNDESSFQSARSIVQRASLVHMTLRTTQMAGNEVPFLLGESYKPVPAILLPRFLVAEKPFSHEGTTILNIHYGLQDREGTETTTIGWGLMNEAYANFGLSGVAMLGVLLGIVFATIERSGKGMPIDSLRVLYGFFFVGIAINTEATMGVFASVWFQGSVGLLCLLPLMRLVRYEDILQRSAAPSK